MPDCADNAQSTLYVVGAAGQLGSQLVSRSGGRVRGLSSADIDVTDDESVRHALAGLGSRDVVINCAAYTDVDAAEDEPAAAEAVNTAGPRLLAAATSRAGAWLIHLSTDYVFAGTATRPYEPGDVNAGDANTVYGRTKHYGEIAAMVVDPATTVVRTAWLYNGAPGGRDFVATIRALEASRDTIEVVADQAGSPTYVADLAEGLLELAGRGRPHAASEVLHATNGGSCTRWELARAVFVEIGADPGRVNACTSDGFSRPASRPSYSVLSGDSWVRAGLTPLRGWRSALHAAFAEGGR